MTDSGCNASRRAARAASGPGSAALKADELLAVGRIRPAGLREVETAKRDGRWEAAYPSQRTIEVPPDLRAALDALSPSPPGI